MTKPSLSEAMLRVEETEHQDAQEADGGAPMQPLNRPKIKSKDQIDMEEMERRALSAPVIESFLQMASVARGGKVIFGPEDLMMLEHMQKMSNAVIEKSRLVKEAKAS
jgi:hypothetical protein